jgi:Calcineurin-like phosphoesterase superfamily domain
MNTQASTAEVRAAPRNIARRLARSRLALIVAWVAACLTLALGGTVLGLRVAGPSVEETALGSVSVRVRPAWEGSVDAFIPIADWGVGARPFSAPMELHIEPRRVDRGALLEAAAGDQRVLLRAEEDAREAAGDSIRRALLWSVAGAFALGAVAYLAVAAVRGWGAGRMVACVLGPPLAALVLGALVIERARATFDPDAFQRPSFYARGAELAQLLEVAGEAQGHEERYRNSVQRTLSSYATLLTAGGRLSRVDTSAPAVLLSDLHGNVVALRSFKRLFAGRPVFFAGDFGQRGTRAEAELLIPRLTNLGRPLVAVSGNHDSRFFMRRLAAAGAIVLTERGRLRADGSTDGKPVQTVAGLRVAGFRDPLEWRRPEPGNPDRVFSFAERAEGRREYARAKERLYRWYDALESAPEVVLIHQNGLAQALARRVQEVGDPDGLLILTGHDHEQHIDLYGDVTVVDAGTAGAGGAFGIATTPVGVAPLHFAADGARLWAVDLVQVEPISGAAKAERVIPGSPDACDVDRVRCHGDGSAD